MGTLGSESKLELDLSFCPLLNRNWPEDIVLQSCINGCTDVRNVTSAQIYEAPDGDFE